ncbi:hypothetical protein CBR_g46222 [Chara braunii]|uniref:Uncharacterized protein n=1 Tax=Chara braunii TaxID=69332 RepID=A0A388K3Q0_CHABU|nr:hypothetical protein CBR_g46222 [Chara braunii]|eukprot:GBG64680.1 hypothetical protein CBR_g46222 [Chara braunii]
MSEMETAFIADHWPCGAVARIMPWVSCCLGKVYFSPLAIGACGYQDVNLEEQPPSIGLQFVHPRTVQMAMRTGRGRTHKRTKWIWVLAPVAKWGILAHGLLVHGMSGVTEAVWGFTTGLVPCFPDEMWGLAYWLPQHDTFVGLPSTVARILRFAVCHRRSDCHGLGWFSNSFFRAR